MRRYLSIFFNNKKGNDNSRGKFVCFNQNKQKILSIVGHQFSSFSSPTSFSWWWWWWFRSILANALTHTFPATNCNDDDDNNHKRDEQDTHRTKFTTTITVIELELKSIQNMMCHLKQLLTHKWLFVNLFFVVVVGIFCILLCRR